MRDADLFLAETKAHTLLLKYCIEKPGYDIVALARVMGLEVIFGGLEKVDAWLLRRDDGTGVIRVSDTIPDANRRRFSIAHEIGHWILHEGRSQGYLCTAKDLRDYAKSPEEAEANIFAAALLIPRMFIKSQMLSGDPTFKCAKKLANTCQTSLTSASRRLVELSKKRVILVCCFNYKITWSIPSTGAKNLWLDRTNLPVKSLTKASFDAKETINTFKPQPPSIWFPSIDFHRDEELFEEVMYAKNIDMTLTLLWLP